MTFTNRVGELAEEQGHHPALLTEWGRVTVTWWTQQIRNLHVNDFVMARRRIRRSGVGEGGRGRGTARKLPPIAWPRPWPWRWGCQGDDSGLRTLVPERIGAVEIPPDTRGLIALLSDESTACVAEDFEYLVHCFDRSGGLVGVFGGEGEGPGEFDMTNVLVAGRDGTLGVLDFGLNRFSVFEPSGVLVTEMLLPAAAAADLIPVWRFGESVVGVAITTFDFALFEAGAGSGGFMSMFEIDIASGMVIRQEELPPVDADIECGKVHYGIPRSRGPAGSSPPAGDIWSS